jgi:hypothetical protein
MAWFLAGLPEAGSTAGGVTMSSWGDVLKISSL